jgi:hypothetical protein
LALSAAGAAIGVVCADVDAAIEGAALGNFALLSATGGVGASAGFFGAAAGSIGATIASDVTGGFAAGATTISFVLSLVAFSAAIGGASGLAAGGSVFATGAGSAFLGGGGVSKGGGAKSVAWSVCAATDFVAGLADSSTIRT